jgi:hypothetical protein
MAEIWAKKGEHAHNKYTKAPMQSRNDNGTDRKGGAVQWASGRELPAHRNLSGLSSAHRLQRLPATACGACVYMSMCMCGSTRRRPFGGCLALCSVLTSTRTASSRTARRRGDEATRRLWNEAAAASGLRGAMARTDGACHDGTGGRERARVLGWLQDAQGRGVACCRWPA